jgi:hypothetical protein
VPVSKLVFQYLDRGSFTQPEQGSIHTIPWYLAFFPLLSSNAISHNNKSRIYQQHVTASKPNRKTPQPGYYISMAAAIESQR